MSIQSWTLHGLDTWFFRESRPHERVGGTELGSLFPPPARTVAGALRTAMGNALGVEIVKVLNLGDRRGMKQVSACRSKRGARFWSHKYL